ncbi:hypothetical protein JCM24511_03738 [Saitozyma sp. JCM 24511]|nr:hypothetical protein JCM24511_03738 [Saitozyma sp. JCM 24511]
MGLHRDGQSWNLSAEDLNLRRRVFWEAFSTDVFLSRCWDRPTNIAAGQYDTKMPEDVSAFDTSRFKLSVLVKEALDISVAVTPTPYPRVLEIWRQMDQHILACDYSAAVFLLFRPYFVEALYAHPSDPTQSPYAGAYLAVIERSTMLVAMCRSIHALFAHLTATCLATVCVINPTSPLASLALSEIETVISLSQAISTSQPRRGLKQSIDWLLWLQTKARARVLEVQGKSPLESMLSTAIPSVSSPVDNAEEHLSLVGWRTRLIRLGPATPSHLLVQRSPVLTQHVHAASDSAGLSTINLSAIFPNPQQAWPADMQLPPQLDPAGNVGVEAGVDDAAIDFLQHLLGAPAGQPFPVEWPDVSDESDQFNAFFGYSFAS